jgi:hypothetical protein
VDREEGAAEEEEKDGAGRGEPSARQAEGERGERLGDGEAEEGHAFRPEPGDGRVEEIDALAGEGPDREQGVELPPAVGFRHRAAQAWKAYGDEDRRGQRKEPRGETPRSAGPRNGGVRDRGGRPPRLGAGNEADGEPDQEPRGVVRP